MVEAKVRCDSCGDEQGALAFQFDRVTFSRLIGMAECNKVSVELCDSCGKKVRDILRELCPGVTAPHSDWREAFVLTPTPGAL